MVLGARSFPVPSITSQRGFAATNFIWLPLPQWELYCAVETGSTFAICLGATQQEAFEKALLRDHSSVIKALSNIDANQAKGSKKDTQMILGAIRGLPGGVEAVNAKAIARESTSPSNLLFRLRVRLCGRFHRG